MKRLVTRIWPKSLAWRLTILLVAALAIAQFALTVTIRGHQDLIVSNLFHSQTLNQTVTLARLLNDYPVADEDRITDAFASREACAGVSTAAPPAHTMNDAEQQLADGLSGMLHGIRAGTPVVAFLPSSSFRQGCANTGEFETSERTSPPEQRDADDDRPLRRDGPDKRTAVSMSVPLLDGRWLTVNTTVDLPHGFDPFTLASFLLSSLAVALVAVMAVRIETRSLRTLADASERFGRGETVEPLPTTGPSEVAAATRAFNTMQERLSLFMRDRLRLLASISHDLRTPLTTLRLKAEFIDDENRREDIVATIDELTVICDATLAFSHAEATTEDTLPTDMAALARDVVEEFTLAGKPVQLGETVPITCNCRPVSLKRAVRNLIENAVRYGQEATISVRRSDQSVIIDIDDKGPGLPADKLDDAFKPFVRLEPSRSVETGGIGLGLSIAQGIVRAHGGAIRLINRDEGGLRAEITLPGDAHKG